jgi:hypothetical protein
MKQDICGMLMLGDEGVPIETHETSLLCLR